MLPPVCECSHSVANAATLRYSESDVKRRDSQQFDFLDRSIPAGESPPCLEKVLGCILSDT